MIMLSYHKSLCLIERLYYAQLWLEVKSTAGGGLLSMSNLVPKVFPSAISCFMGLVHCKYWRLLKPGVLRQTREEGKRSRKNNGDALLIGRNWPYRLCTQQKEHNTKETNETNLCWSLLSTWYANLRGFFQTLGPVQLWFRGALNLTKFEVLLSSQWRASISLHLFFITKCAKILKSYTKPCKIKIILTVSWSRIGSSHLVKTC